jgi:hypothetical protein
MVRLEKDIRMRYVVTSLSLAALAVQNRDYLTAVSALQDARLWARTLKSRKGRLIATQCVIAQQAIMPYLTGL